MSEMGLLMQWSSEFVIRSLHLQPVCIHCWGLTTHNELLNITTSHSWDSSIIKQAFCQVFPHPLLYLSSLLKLIDCQNKCSIASHPAICCIFSKFRLDTLSFESSVGSTKLKCNHSIFHQMCNSISYCNWKKEAVIKDYPLRCVNTQWKALLVRNTKPPLLAVTDNCCSCWKWCRNGQVSQLWCETGSTGPLSLYKLPAGDKSSAQWLAAVCVNLSQAAIGREMSGRLEWQVNLDRAVEMWEGSGGWRADMEDGGI